MRLGTGRLRGQRGQAGSRRLYGGVAATVNGTEIPEDTITAQIQMIRAQMSVDTEDAWGAWLAENGYTPETVREQIISGYADQELVRQGAAQKGVTVEDDDIEAVLNATKAQYDSEEAWEQALKQSGTTEDDYRHNLEQQILVRNLYATFATNEEPSEEDVLTYAKMYVSSFDNAKRSSHILFSAEDEATAQSVLDQINAGTLDFVEAVQEYSTDSAAKEKDGDVGWDKLSSFDAAYQEALDGLEKDQVSGLVTSSFGIHIIKCTDVYKAPEELTSTDQIPTEFVEQLKSMVSQNNQSQAYQAWLDGLKEAAEIVVNDMPEGLPYDVDMTKYQTSDGSVTNEDGSTTVTNDDGTTTTTYVDGSTKTMDAEGNVISETPATSATARRTARTQATARLTAAPTTASLPTTAKRATAPATPVLNSRRKPPNRRGPSGVVAERLQFDFPDALSLLFVDQHVVGDDRLDGASRQFGQIPHGEQKRAFLFVLDPFGAAGTLEHRRRGLAVVAIHLCRLQEEVLRVQPKEAVVGKAALVHLPYLAAVLVFQRAVVDVEVQVLFEGERHEPQGQHFAAGDPEGCPHTRTRTARGKAGSLS